MSNFIESKLKEFEEKFPDLYKEDRPGQHWSPVTDMTEPVKAFLESALTQQQEAIEGCLPEERRKTFADYACKSCKRGEMLCQCDGFNQCRSTFLQNLKRIKD